MVAVGEEVFPSTSVSGQTEYTTILVATGLLVPVSMCSMLLLLTFRVLRLLAPWKSLALR